MRSLTQCFSMGEMGNSGLTPSWWMNMWINKSPQPSAHSQTLPDTQNSRIIDWTDLCFNSALLLLSVLKWRGLQLLIELLTQECFKIMNGRRRKTNAELICVAQPAGNCLRSRDNSCCQRKRLLSDYRQDCLGAEVFWCKGRESCHHCSSGQHTHTYTTDTNTP